jgi:uncharacterized Ntn-hydrolase superfamily protein
MATAASHLQNDFHHLHGPCKQTVADSVDGLWYMPDTNGDLIVAAGNVLAGPLDRAAKVGDYVNIVVQGKVPAIASGAITAGAAVTVDSAGKVKAATVGTDQVHGYCLKTCTTDGDRISVFKTA